MIFLFVVASSFVILRITETSLILSMNNSIKNKFIKTRLNYLINIKASWKLNFNIHRTKNIELWLKVKAANNKKNRNKRMSQLVLLFSFKLHFRLSDSWLSRKKLSFSLLLVWIWCLVSNQFCKLQGLSIWNLHVILYWRGCSLGTSPYSYSPNMHI